MSAVPQRGRSLRAYVGALILLILVVTLGTTAFGLARAEDTALRSAQQDAAFAASQAATELAATVSIVRSTVSQTAANPGAAAAFDNAACGITFGTVGSLQKTHLDLVRPDGSVRCSSIGPAEAAYRDASWLPAALAGATFTDPVVDQRTGRTTIVSAAPVAGRGAVVAFADITDLAAATAARFGGPRSLVFSITTDAGTPVSVPAAGLGADAVTARVAVAGAGWQLQAGAGRDATLAAARDLFFQQTASSLIGLLVILMGTIVIYRAIAYPIWRLDRDVSHRLVTAGAAPLTERGPREIRQLARSFNAVVASLRAELTQRELSDEQARKLEHRLEQSQRMESLGQLAGGVAHDFNNLLAVILSYLDFVDDALPHDSAVRADVDEVRKAAQRAALLTRQLLIFARRDMTKTELVDLNSIVDGLDGLLRRTLGEHIELVVAPGGSLPPVRADRTQLDQVVLNLAVNSRDAMPKGGRLTIETSEVVLGDEQPRSPLPPGRYVRLTVSDTGEGMPTGVAQRAFEPFFTTKPAGQGTGLGLATVYGIVTRSGGDVRIYSEPGHGTVVRVDLPASDEPAPAAADRSVAPPVPGDQQHVLVVEDEPAVLLAAVRILRSNGYSADGLSDPTEALRVLGDPVVPIDVLITDVVMPGLSGIELARRATELRPDLPVLFTSGYSHDAVSRQGLIPDGTVLLQKPFMRAALLEAVHEALGRKKANGD
ncbi:MAG TPA: ATP-binding protein [Candidatus Limnocylindria bacterium]